MIEIFVRDPDLNIVDQVDDFTKFTGILRYNDVGSMSLDMPVNAISATLTEPGAGIVVFEDDEPLMSGIATRPDRTLSTTADGYLMTFVTDEAVLQDTLVYPCAPVAQGDGTHKFVASEYDVRVGVAETVMRAFVLANAGPTNPSYPWTRPVPGLSVAVNLGRGPNVTGRARMASLLELEQSLANLGGLGFRVFNLLFEVTSPTDLTADIAFSTDIGNLQEYRYSVSRPQATHFAIGGGGEGVDRIFLLQGDNTAATRWGWRIEQFKDRRDTTDYDELYQTYTEERDDKQETAAFAITPLDIEGYAFGVDYKLGDSVTGEVDGVAVPGVINQVTLSADSTGIVVRPNFSTAATAQAAYTLKTFDILRKQQRRLSALERTL